MPVAALNAHLQTVHADGAERPKIAFFDLDRTLIAGYSIAAIARERIRDGFTRGELIESTAILRDLLRQQRTGETEVKGPAYHRLVQRLSKRLAGTSEATLTKLGERAYQNTIARNLFSEAIQLLEAHRRAGHRIVIVSAATRYQVDPIARELGVDEVCCTGLEVVDGKFTGQVLTPLCYGDGKAMAARRVCRRTGAKLQDCWFYSDSFDDLPLLRLVGHPVAVNPNEKLAEYARAKDWPQLHFASRGMPTLADVLRTLLTAQTVAATTALCAVSRRVGVSRIASGSLVTRILGDIGTTVAGIEVEVDGVEHLQSARPAVFIFNHQSFLDVMVLAHILREDIVALCKRELADNPLLGAMLRQVNTIFVDRDDGNQSAVLKESLAALDSGRSLLIAPEGTRSTLGEIQPFKHGAFYLAKRAGVPVVPIVLHNVKDALPKGGLTVRATTVRVTVLPAMDPAKMGGVRQTCEAMEQAYGRVLGNSEVAALPSRVRRRA